MSGVPHLTAGRGGQGPCRSSLLFRGGSAWGGLPSKEKKPEEGEKKHKKEKKTKEEGSGSDFADLAAVPNSLEVIKGVSEFSKRRSLDW